MSLCHTFSQTDGPSPSTPTHHPVHETPLTCHPLTRPLLLCAHSMRTHIVLDDPKALMESPQQTLVTADKLSKAPVNNITCWLVPGVKLTPTGPLNKPTPCL